MRDYNKQKGDTFLFIMIGVVVLVLVLFGVTLTIIQMSTLPHPRPGPLAFADRDMRVLQAGIESYQVEYNGTLPPNLHCMTTPIAFLQRIPKSPYGAGPYYSYYHENSNTPGTPSVYLFWCTGPDEKNDLTKSLLSQRIKQERERVGNKISSDSITMLLYDLAYDASNGMQSSGDVFRVVVDTIPSSSTASR